MATRYIKKMPSLDRSRPWIVYRASGSVILPVGGFSSWRAAWGYARFAVACEKWSARYV